MQLSWLASAGLIIGATVAAQPFGQVQRPLVGACKCLPADDCWPAKQEWAKLNATVNGRLVATVPLGNACHGDDYDEVECDRLREEWRFSEIQ